MTARHHIEITKRTHGPTGDGPPNSARLRAPPVLEQGERYTCIQRLRTFELAFEILDGEAEGCGAAMRAVAGFLDQMTLSHQCVDLLIGQRVARLHRGLAGHHVDEFVDDGFGLGRTTLLGELVKKIAHEGNDIGIPQ